MSMDTCCCLEAEQQVVNRALGRALCLEGWDPHEGLTTCQAMPCHAQLCHAGPCFSSNLYAMR